MFTRRAFSVGIIASPRQGPSSPGVPIDSAHHPRIDRQRPMGPRPRQARTRSRANMPERLHFPACPGLRDHTGLRWTSEFCHRNPLARGSVTKEVACCRPSARDHGYCEVKC